MRLKFTLAALLLFIVAPAFGQADAPVWGVPKKGKPPVIVIPGILGSDLVNKDTGEVVWFDLTRSKDDDLKLPISPNLAANKDKLVAKDILRNISFFDVLPQVEIYQSLIASLENEGYTEAKWDAPGDNGFQDSFYVFAYDWRRDNVENARELIRKIEGVKMRLGKPALKFNIVSHSMGGLIARYAARYGDADLPDKGSLKPNWAGAKHINKIFLVGTPNEGSTSALDVLVNGISLNPRGINIPFLQSIAKFDVFTTPSVYQLLPHNGTAKIYDENLKRIDVDLFDVETWEKYGWAPYLDKKFTEKFSPEDQRLAPKFLASVLKRAERFHEAIDSGMNQKSPVALYLIGSGCKQTLEGAVLRGEGGGKKWEAIFKPKNFKRADGTTVTAAELKDLLYSEGDGTVTKDSLLTASAPMAMRRKDGNVTKLNVADVFFTCESHQKLMGNPEVQKRLFAALVE